MLSSHIKAKFPNVRGVEIDGVDLVLIDADIIGIVETYVGNKGRLSNHKLQLLKSCQLDVNKVIFKLKGYDQQYFKKLNEMAKIILADRWGVRP